MVSSIDAERFNLLFKGKNNSYVKNLLPKEVSSTGKKIKTQITTHEGKVDKELITHHLDGDFGVGVCPVNVEGKCFFGVIDIDYYGSKLKRVLNLISEYQLPLVPFRSKSGGLHCYLFLSKATSAKKVRETLDKIITTFSLDNLFGKEKVEVFPKQDKAEGFGSSVTLPYFNCENTINPMLDLDGNPVEFQECLLYLSKKQSSLEEVKECLDNLPYKDAPPCIQKILLSGSVGSEDSGRNNFLYSFSIYAKKKYGAGFEDYVKEVNNSFESPLSENDVETVCASVRDNEYVYKCKDIPCKAFCSKPECRKREFGLGRDKGHFTGIDYGQLFRYMTAEPYYIWKLRLIGQENFVDVVFKDEGYLLDQKNFAKMCVRYLNQAPMQVSNNDWYAILNSVLPNVQNVEVAKESDTSVLSNLSNAFVRYLANKQARRDCPYQIRVGLCVRQVVKGKAKFYFTHSGFEDYLNNNKIKYDASMMRETLKSFGAVEDVLEYQNALGESRRFPCWSKEEDERIDDEFLGTMEVYNGDKESFNQSISEATNIEVEELKEKEKQYTSEDWNNAQEMF